MWSLRYKTNMTKLVLQLRSESDDGMMSDQGSGFSLSVDQDDYHFRPSNVFIPAIPGQSSPQPQSVPKTLNSGVSVHSLNLKVLT